jgi:transglutaminase-like putative cysteine protease
MSTEPEARLLRRPKEVPEDSVRLRALVLATVMVSVAAVIAQGAVDTATAVGSLVLIPVGYVFSHIRRHQRNVVLKIVLAAGLLASLGGFILQVNLAVSVDAARASLASLFLWVQILHSFDLPRRRDLAFSIASSVILMAEAGSLSLDTDLLLFLVPWCALAGLWLYVSQHRAAEAAATATATPPAGATGSARDWVGVLRAAVRTGAIVVLAAGLVFISLPRLGGMNVTALPFSISQRVQAGGGGVVNPNLPAARGDRPAAFSGLGYPGFGAGVDLRSRGTLSERIVLKVRSSQPGLWRGQAYDAFDGVRWSASLTDLVAVGGAAPLTIPVPDHDVVGVGEELVQTFYVQVEQPNIVFGAYQARQLYFPAAGVEIDPYGTVISPLLLEEGMVYSVVSTVPARDPQLLRHQVQYPEGFDEALYTQLPEGFSPRVRDLARQITAGAPTDYDRALAVQSWLRGNTRYNLQVPPEPEGRDPLETFLFDRREGFCEHIATAMAMLLRAAGVPTRLAVGFGPGKRNVLTGYFEVAESDAHAWVEVYLPFTGWLQFDPTFGVPDAAGGGGPRWVFGQVLRDVATFVGGLIPESVRDAAKSAGRAIARAGVAVAGAWPVVAGALALAVPLAMLLRRRRQRGPPLSPAAEAFVAMCRAFEARGISRPASRTPREHLGRLLAEDPVARREGDAVALIVATFERELFSPSPPGDAELAAARRGLERVAAAARSRQGTTIS